MFKLNENGTVMKNKAEPVKRMPFSGAGVFQQNAGLIVGLLLICVVMSVISPNFLSENNILTVLRQVSINAIIAFGMTFVILVRGIDLSVGAVMAMVGIVSAGLAVREGVPLVLAVAAGVALGTLVGVLNGVLVTRLRLPGFIVTLATTYIARGIALVYSDGRPIYIKEPAFNALGNESLFGVPLPIYYMAFAYIVLGIILKKTVFGKHVYATGGNPDAARFSGINVSRVQIIAYTLTGFMASIAGVIMTARLYSGQPSVGTNAELDAIAAVILGGASFSGGVGTLTGTLLGALTIGVLNNGLNLLGVSPFWQLIVKGIVIIVAIFFEGYRKSRSRT
jgi:ribose transport system permease protein